MYKYTLIKGSKKNICPKCQKKRFVNYQNMETGELLPPMVGRCDREINCGYHLTPKEFFKDSNIDVDFHINKVLIPEIKTPTFHPIKNKKVILYPDLSINQKAYKEWKTTSEKLNKKDFNISVSHLLEDHCSEQQREKGYDIADYFLNTSIHNIRKQLN